MGGVKKLKLMGRGREKKAKKGEKTGANAAAITNKQNLGKSGVKSALTGDNVHSIKKKGSSTRRKLEGGKKKMSSFARSRRRIKPKTRNGERKDFD